VASLEGWSGEVANLAVMRASTDTVLVHVVAVYGPAKPHCFHMFAKCRTNQIKNTRT
jgi:hypothetical protein